MPSESSAVPPWLSVAAAARRLGIAPATLRTWDRRYGLGPTGHVAGQHRRYAGHDIARLELMRSALAGGATPAAAAEYALAAGPPFPPDADQPVTPAVPRAPAIRPARRTGAETGAETGAVAASNTGGDQVAVDSGGPAGAAAPVRMNGQMLRMPGAGRRARGLGRVALALDATAVCAVLTEAIGALGVQASWNDVARPVLSAVGQRWAESGAGVEIEHLLSECVVRVFGAVTVAMPDVDRRPVLLAGVPGEQHSLPMVVLAATLAQRGVTCRPMGPDLPVEALVSAIRRIAPAAVVLWAQRPPTTDPVLGRLPRTRPSVRVYVAGPGWSGVELPPRVVWLTSLEQATDWISDDQRLIRNHSSSS